MNRHQFEHSHFFNERRSYDRCNIIYDKWAVLKKNQESQVEKDAQPKNSLSGKCFCAIDPDSTYVIQENRREQDNCKEMLAPEIEQ